MTSQPKPQWVVPNPQVPRTFGLLNIIFGVLLLLTGIVWATLMSLAPAFAKAMQASAEQQQATVKAQREAQIADLKQKQAAAKNEEEKKSLQAELAAVESVPVVDTSGLTNISDMNAMTDRRLTIYAYSEIGVGIVLNVLMIVAGAGLMGLAEWGRRLALGVAWLKIARWAVMIVFTLVVVMPITMERMNKVFAKVDAQMQARPGAATPPFRMTDLGRWSAIFGGLTVVGSAVVASIYPALTLWFLTRPNARAACLAGAAKPEGPAGEGEEGALKWS